MIEWVSCFLQHWTKWEMEPVGVGKMQANAKEIEVIVKIQFILLMIMLL